MGVTETLIVYLLIGTAVGASLWLAHSARPAERTAARLTTWILFWPFFAPHALGQAGGSGTGSAATAVVPGARLNEAQDRLMSAIRSVDGLAEGVLRPHLTQIDSMMGSLDHARNRLAEMEELLRSREFDRGRVEDGLRDLRDRGYEADEPRVRSLESRRRNIQRLEAMRDHTRDELERALLRLEEISSQVMLLRFAEQPETRLASLLKDVAGNVDDLARAVLEVNDLC